eukprot:CAMPEP_0181228360 /NCGR_PEP_ID=MMETSP1096-20121128/33305_1 /TAXON_ID=156174 ORGANISM="Chrysochromulina ericina, Strain CCMP281" /NCGR_SAMPLE_ID=MMETSP1096 /ASSEMBLY_ACC=CAM_ASM_000453 /LENGTH=31 /DNA_ID= /DNA_START= /DNA_END= /DNA_ORIENTATION=
MWTNLSGTVAASRQCPAHTSRIALAEEARAL